LDQLPASEGELNELADQLGLSALCLSGGGIRSAAFCLGVLQALARARLLSCFDYLSSVSGGGYTASWLQRMIFDRGSPAAAEDALGERAKLPVEVSGLRDYTSYLAPQGGILSTDTWADIVLYGRNVLLNWLVYLPLLVIAVLGAIFFRTAIWTTAHSRCAQLACVATGAVYVAVQTLFVIRNLPDHRPARAARPDYAAPDQITREVIWPSFGWAALAPLSQGVLDDTARPPVATLLIAYFAAQSIGYLGAALWLSRGDRSPHLYGRNSLAFGAATIVSTTVLGCGAGLATLVGADERAQLLATLGPLWAMLAFGIHSAVFVGLRRDSALFDLDREWLARVSAVKLRAGILWAAFTFAALSLTWLLHNAGSRPTWLAALVTLVTGSAGAWVGKHAGSQVGAIVREVTTSQRLRSLALNLICLAFILGLIAMLGLATDAMLGWAQLALEAGRLRPPLQEVPYWLLFLVQILALLGLALTLRWVNRRVNVNRYSMHAVYRNRLIRAFLGSARGPARHPDPLTNFDPEDNLPLAALCDAPGPRKLFPVLNMTLNLTVAAAAAWSERKAMAFTATPTACGAPLLTRLGVDGRPALQEACGVYVPTGSYGGRENPDASSDEARGLSLATAMTISGAAVSPNWGYHSSPLVAFVMTLFNVRLGAWLPNPAAVDSAAELNLAYPPRSLRALLGELLGAAGDKSEAIYLSDGGHFDNLGLYEMLRRRCHLILAIDCGEDARCSFEDLGNALRKAAIDMQISIMFDSAPRIASRYEEAATTDALGFAIATIRYPEATGCNGKLLYVKPSLLPDVPADVRAFANRHASFPHDSTLDQFFTESQFESYRALGQFQMERLIGDTPVVNLSSLFDQAAAFYRVPDDEIASKSAMAQKPMNKVESYPHS